MSLHPQKSKVRAHARRFLLSASLAWVTFTPLRATDWQKHVILINENGALVDAYSGDGLTTCVAGGQERPYIQRLLRDIETERKGKKLIIFI